MTDHHELVDEATQYLTYLIARLGQTYDDLHPQDVEIEELGNAVDAMIFANEKLKEQKIKLEDYRKKLQDNITSTYKEKA